MDIIPLLEGQFSKADVDFGVVVVFFVLLLRSKVATLDDDP